MTLPRRWSGSHARSEPVPRLLTLGVLAVAAISGCQPQRETFVDGPEQARFGGRDYSGVNGALFEIDPVALRQIGSATTNLPNSDGRAYALAGVDPNRVIVMVDGARTALFVESHVLFGLPSPGPLGDPLAVAMPELCTYWAPPKPAVCPQMGSPAP